MTLREFFQAHPRAALAFSGGADSSYLLYAAKRYGARVTAYFVKSAFQPEFELEDARRLAAELGMPLKLLPVDVLADSEVAANPGNRCYFCKKRIFEVILREAAADGFALVLDGTNASDDGADRPGMKALEELRVLSPLRLCGITKAEVRALSRAAGLFTWDKPAYACLATRVPAGRAITAGLLQKIEQAENALFALGFADFRVRISGDGARLELPAPQMPKLLEQRAAVLEQLSPYFQHILLDLRPRAEEQTETGGSPHEQAENFNYS